MSRKKSKPKLNSLTSSLAVLFFISFHLLGISTFLVWERGFRHTLGKTQFIHFLPISKSFHFCSALKAPSLQSLTVLESYQVFKHLWAVTSVPMANSYMFGEVRHHCRACDARSHNGPGGWRIRGGMKDKREEKMKGTTPSHLRK